jgi:uncharacterized membrane protein YhaH (DUF805 family)
MVKLFTMQGRITRKQYILTSLAVSAVAFVVAFVIGFASGMAGMSEEASGSIGTAVSFAAAFVQAFLVVRRLHDIGKPGWHYWLLLVPLYNIYLGLVILFTPGTQGSNEYGPDPSVA